MDKKNNNDAELDELVSKQIDSYEPLRYYLKAAETFDTTHYGFPLIYYKMMDTDETRISAFSRAFQQHDLLKNATVCEVGVGRMALTKLFLDHCKHAYLIESNPNVIDFIRAELKNNNWEKRVTLIEGDALKLDLPEKVDYIVGELMSVWCANEFQVPIFQHMRKWLKQPEGRLFPEKIKNLIQVGYAVFDPSHSETYYPLMFTRHWPCLMTDQIVVNVIDLYTIEDCNVECQVVVRALLSGKVNCVLLNSFVQVTSGSNFTGTDSLMPPTVVKLSNANDFEIEEDHQYILKIRVTYATSLNQASFTIADTKDL